MERNDSTVRWPLLHREYANKRDVRIYDYAEHDNLKLARMWDKRQRGYKAIGYQVNLLG